MKQLNTINHDRDSAALRYVYPVISRRAGGVSIGINLNTNNACNWRCIYCQVPDLQRGGPDAIDLDVLEQELRTFLQQVLHGDFMQQRVPPDMRRLNDIALSGNGEPTSSAEFAEVILLIRQLRQALAVPSDVKTVLISNGSLMYRPQTQQGLRQLAQMNGEVWFKLDRASSAGMAHINDIQYSLEKALNHLVVSCALCPTWLQTCWFALDGQAPSLQDEQDYLAMLQDLKLKNVPLMGVLLYGLARTSYQPEAPRLSALSAEKMEAFAAKIRELGFATKVSV